MTMGLFLISFIPVNGLCSSISNVNVKQVVVQAANSVGVDRVCVYPDQMPEDKALCATFNRYCADVTTDIGKALLSTALTAYATQKPVSISGSGTCDLVTNSEDIAYMMVK
ncbi:MAG: hypothetical protein GY834_08120 [Bacteroidetes bacterium]|nr:hypothetical protein [Bacteroidota bacterium]